MEIIPVPSIDIIQIMGCHFIWKRGERHCMKKDKHRDTVQDNDDILIAAFSIHSG